MLSKCKLKCVGTPCMHTTHTHNQATCTILKVEKMDALKMQAQVCSVHKPLRHIYTICFFVQDPRFRTLDPWLSMHDFWCMTFDAWLSIHDSRFTILDSWLLNRNSNSWSPGIQQTPHSAQQPNQTHTYNMLLFCATIQIDPHVYTLFIPSLLRNTTKSDPQAHTLLSNHT